MKKAFTLIELLVVVLIIGILAAVALPKYQVAVAKAHYQQLKVAGDALRKAQITYYLANGSYPSDFDSLDISLGTPKETKTIEVEGYGYQTQVRFDWGQCSLSSYGNRIQCVSSYSGVPEYAIFGDKRYCQGTGNSTVKKQVCASETGVSTAEDMSSYWRYTYP